VNQRNKTAVFLAILITQTISLIGSRMTAVGMGIWVFKRTGSATPLLLASFFAEMPGMLFGSLAGVLVDRWPRKWVMILADSGQATGSLLLLASLLSGRFELWHLYGVSLLQGTFAIFQSPAENATTTLLVPEGWRERANAIRETIFPMAGVGAPVLAGLVIAWIGVPGIIAIDLTTFVIAVLVVLYLRIPQPKATQEGSHGRGSMKGELSAVLRFLFARPALGYFILFGVFLNFMLNGPLELTIPYLLTITGKEQTAGGLMGVASLGAMAGALLMTAWGGTRPRIHTLMPVLMLSGVMFIVYGTTRQPLILGVALFLLMAPLPISGTIFVSILQVKTPPDLQGRLFALESQLGFVGSTASFLLTGPLVDKVLEPAAKGPGWQVVAPIVGQGPGAGIGLLEVVTGVLILVVTVGMYAWPLIRKMEMNLPDYAAVEAEEQA
jgi:MFS family permease